MNINTNALLNNLLTKVDSTLKSKIEKLATEGKVDIPSLKQEKGIESLLNGLFKDISSGTKNKTEVSNLLEGSKQSLKFKDISTDLKQIVSLLNKEMKSTPEIEKLTSLLKTSLIDIKNIDEKILKSSFQNSGVFLESKLATSKETVSSNLKNLLTQLNDKIKILNSLDKLTIKSSSEHVEQKTSMPSNTVAEKSTSPKVLNITKEIVSPKMELIPKNVISSKESIGQKEIVSHKEITIQKDIINQKSQNLSSENLSSIKIPSSNETRNPPITENTTTYSSKISKLFSEIKNDLSLQKVFNLSNEVKNDVKQDVQSILKKVESLPAIPQIEKQLNILQTITSDIKNLEQKFIKLDIKNDVTLNLKELTQQAKNNILNDSSRGLDKTILLVKTQLDNIKSTNLTEIKNDVKNIDTKIEKLHTEKNVESKIAIVKELIQNTTNIISKINTGNIQELLKNNISELKNISGDLKTIMLQVKDIVEQPNNTETVSKELKASVDKILAQIDYYQLSSYSSNSNHSYVSFLQDDLEDVDIKFNNSKDEEFSCLIHLSLKEKGDLKILLQLDQKSGININIGVEQEEFKMMIQDALQTLRVQMNSLGLSIVSLNIFDLDDNSTQSPKLNAYSTNLDLDFGVDIKV